MNDKMHELVVINTSVDRRIEGLSLKEAIPRGTNRDNCA